uniref:Uncharacterized protein n=1 Tax=Anguilla anguilla TaxID=7936 RepID=A0A0E9R2I9_ANGAN
MDSGAQNQINICPLFRSEGCIQLTVTHVSRQACIALHFKFVVAYHVV